MRVGSKGDLVFVRMDDGEDFFEDLEVVFRETGIRSASVIGAIGMLRDFEIGWFNVEKGEYEREFVSVPHELLSVQGNVSLLDGKPFLHAHVSLAGPSRSVVGGHLFKGVVCNTVEMFLLKLPFGLGRFGEGRFKRLDLLDAEDI